MLVRKVLSIPTVYNFFQFIVGARVFRRNLVENYIKPFNGARILDIGCGTCEIYEFLKPYNIDYVGFDISENYIKQANKRFRNKDNGFRAFTGLVSKDHLIELGDFNIVIANGVQHHLNKEELSGMLKISKEAIKNTKGKTVFYDPYLAQDMNFLEWFFAKYDRGRFVRSISEYTYIHKPFYNVASYHDDKLGFLPLRTIVAILNSNE